MKSSARQVLLTLASLGALTAFGASAAGAQARALNFSACNNAPLSQPFAAWGDRSRYELAPGGDFESGAWTLTGGAQLAPGSEPFAATGSLGSSALALTPGASATSPTTCLTAAYRTMRMFVGGRGTVLVSIVFHGRAIPVGAAHAGGRWRPSSIIATGGARFGRLSGGTAHVSVRITGLSGSPVVDDVFIDPWNRT